MQLGFIGLGKMGCRMVIKLLEEGHHLVVWNRSLDTLVNFKQQISNLQFPKENLIIAKTIEELVKSLEKPLIIWIMVPATATQEIINEISVYVKSEDIIIDGGNSYFKDTEQRFENFAKKGVRFLGIGVSGGILAKENGFPLMVGGDKSAYDDIQPILNSLSKHSPQANNASQMGAGYDYFGTGGAGHFVKMVHNGIEYGMMQSLGEGFGVLEKASYNFELEKIAKLWQKGTIISGFLLDRSSDALTKNPKLIDIEGYVQESGEARWTIEAAKSENVPSKVIEDSLQFRLDSQKNDKISKSFAARLIAALRREFGGHAVKEK